MEDVDTRKVIVIHSDASDIEPGQVTTVGESASPRKRKKRKQTSREKEGSTRNEGQAEGSSFGREARRERRKKSRLEKQATGSGSRDPSSERHAPKSRSRSPGSLDNSKLFYFDLAPVVLPNIIDKVAKTDEEDGPSKLLLPSHVQVLGSVPVEILPPSPSDFEDEDYIDYLDYDDRKGLVRYFEKPEDKSTKVVCKNCGAEGEHTTYKCPVMICLTCGARDEHPTRSCPISKNCFKCGMKGHINTNCPNKYQSQGSIGDTCRRCGYRSHITSECPTWWRIYAYITENERVQILNARCNKSKAGLGNGGEGYIAEDEWCYNCGVEGHWGDDCNNAPHAYGVPEDYSAFGSNNLHTGPFADVEVDMSPAIPRRGARDWEKEIDVVDNVGKKGKRKAIEILERSAQQQLENDGDDWFRNRGGGKESKAAKSRANCKPAKKLMFSQSIKSGLLDRMGDTAIDVEPSKRGKSEKEESRRQREKRSHSDKPSSSRSRQSNPYDTFSNARPVRGSSRYYEYRHRDYDRRGPRYNGGYTR
ncbi:uncharacterized protein BT62DRAFT_929198 [Guyanagaster necrorhizus]|uniref:CCHC-type domain-containing protein n=1 Tax=Guyanagaster necrorhizus TaxID=856835 RepID=A0A9P8AV71_9AGAR|nr:uncharacterized protein BT62DRAFT_929198 [Guyanagaster necrorhizus MCA 3950]KAG7449223.1 hypothetical protein BT62DRAFT_929198 [Guyanagaster necrorhizus MCA 3950]